MMLTRHWGTMMVPLRLRSRQKLSLCPQVSRFIPVQFMVSSLTVATAGTMVPLESPSESPQSQEDVQVLSPSAHVPSWPSDTDIQFVPGTTRVILTRQGTLLKSVLQDGFENLRASILFEHAFPDVVLAHSFIRDALITAAARSGPATASIHQRLLNDNNYLKKLAPLVSTIVCPQSHN